MENSRITVLDSFRAIAILGVMLFHFFSRWTYPKTEISLYPYNNEYNFFKYGYVGVEFFFIISGFVIFFTLENTPKFNTFWKKRIIRLVPPIIVASIFTFIIVTLFDSLFIFPASHNPKNFFSSFTFIPPQLLNNLSNTNSWGYIDGSYWSLWPEVQFYLLSSFVYFFNKKNFIPYFMVVSFLMIVIDTGINFLEAHKNYGILTQDFFLYYNKFVDNGFNLVNFLPFFCLGITFYVLYKNHHHALKSTIQTKLYMAFLIVYILFIYGGLNISLTVRLIYLSMLGLFFLFVYSPKYLKIFENNVLTRIGVSSYFLYLIHQNVGVVFIYYFGSFFLPMGFILPLALILMLTALSIFYSEKIDRKISKWLKLKILIDKKP